MAGGLAASIGRSLRRSGADRIFGLSLLVALFVLRIWDPLPIELLRLKTFDIYQVIAPQPKSVRHTVKIVDIDEESLNQYGQWPWPRSQIARLVRNITASGAVAIGFDMVFAEPDRLSSKTLAQTLTGLDQATRTKILALPPSDQQLAAVLARSRVVLGQAAYHRSIKQKNRKADTQVPLATLGTDPRRFLSTFPGMVRNLPILEANAKGRGMFTIVPEKDGIIRRIPLLLKMKDQIWPSLSLELLRVATGSSTTLVKSDDVGIIFVAMGKNKIPTDGKSRVWIQFSPHDKTRYISAGTVLNATKPVPGLAGKLVLIGTSATGLFDIKATPVDPSIPGVEIHAQLLESILSKKQLSRPNWAIGAELVVAALITLLIIFLVPMLGAATTLATGTLMSSAMIMGSWYLFKTKGLVFDPSFPLLASIVVFIALVFVSYFREEYQKRQIRSAFGQYLSPDLVEQLANNPEKLALGGETKQLTIMFSDVRGFTSIAEIYKDDPQGLTTLINSLLTPLSNIIINLNGTIDKYMGDNIMAFWNAPLDDKEHAAHACTAALEMFDSLAELNKTRRENDERDGRLHLPLHIGVGINTGECVVGNIGSDLRFDYSVLGDAVNLSSRLEGQTKGYGVYTILGSRTAELVRDEFAVLALDAIRVKGKQEPEQIYALLGDEAMRNDDDFQSHAILHQQMIQDYLAQKWESAITAAQELEKTGEIYGLQDFYRLYLERLKAYQATPPPSDWDGVYTATSK